MRVSMADNPTELQLQIRAIAEERFGSLYSFAAACGISRKHIYRAMTRSTSVKTLQRMCDALNLCLASKSDKECERVNGKTNRGAKRLDRRK